MTPLRAPTALCLGLGVVLGQVAQVLLARELWWGDWTLLSRWVWFSASWGAVAAALAGVVVCGTVRGAGMHPLSGLAARSRISVYLLPLLPVAGVLVLAHGIVGVLPGLAGNDWAGAPEPYAVLAGLGWLLSGLLTGCVVRLRLPAAISWAVAPLIVFAVTVVAIQGGEQSALYRISPMSFHEFAAFSENPEVSAMRIVALAGTIALLLSAVTLSRVGGIIGLAAVSFSSVMIGSQPVLWKEDNQAPLVCATRAGKSICTPADYGAGRDSYEAYLERILVTVPELAEPFAEIVSRDDGESAGRLWVASGSVENPTAQVPTFDGVAVSFAQQAVAHRCQGSSDLSTALWIRLADVVTGPAGIDHPYLNEWRQALEEGAAADGVSASLHRVNRMGRDELVGLILARRDDPRACAMTLADLGG
ncbi:MAG: hypothetical protein Q4B08_09825 [Propionibacteriaceae bacterium]|nr:hypothetical protein [Propionibacteriaceae bacterium]